jgi:ribose/xylose/arabinose/galactoside ABC-type transport system permease subunit
LDTGRIVGWARDNGVYVAFAVLVLFNAIFTTNFVTTATLFNLLIQVAPVLIVSLGMALVIGTEGIDLSVGSVMAIASAIVPLYIGYGWPVAVLIALVVGTLAGALNGGLVAFVGMQPIIATLALFVGGRGLAQVLVGGQLQIISDPSFLALGQADVLGIPLPVIIAGVLALIVGFVVRRTTFGRYVLAIGGNRAASYLSGHPVRAVLVAVYAISAALATIAGVLATARLSAGDPSTIGILIELDAIAAVVVGGTPLSGGKVSVAGTVMGALVMAVITATFIMNDLPFTYAQILKAIIILIAVYIQRGRGSV